MMRASAAILVALMTAGCAYHNPDAPSPPPPISPAAPFSLTLGAAVGTGANAGQATVTAKVQNVNGATLSGVTVEFATDVGTLSATSVVTGANGTATTTITATNAAAITATAGTLTAHVLVASEPVGATPNPAPPPQPPPPAPLGPLSLTISATSATVGASTIFTANVTNASGPFTVAWDFGDGGTGTSISSTTAHTYLAAGTYVVTAVLRDDAGRTASASATATVNAIPVPPAPTPAPATLNATLTCTTPSPHTTATPCNVNVTYGGVALPATAITQVDWNWGDGFTNTTFPPTAPISTRMYANAGIYTVFATVTASTVDGTKTTTTSFSVTIS